MVRYVRVFIVFFLIASTYANDATSEEEGETTEELQDFQSKEDDDSEVEQNTREVDEENWNGDLNVFENDGNSKWQGLPTTVKKEKRTQEKKLKVKKKDKKMLMEILTAGLLIKSAFLPLAIGFLKLLTGKALMVTMMALTLILAITFRSAKEKTGSSTEIINLLGHHSKHRSLDLAQEVLPIIFDVFPAKLKDS